MSLTMQPAVGGDIAWKGSTSVYLRFEEAASIF